MAQNNERNYRIPDPAIGFYATGLYGLKRKEINLLKSILEPVKQYFDCSLSKYPPHISLRYLGYRDEVGFERIKEIIPLLKKIYSKFLPVECTIGNLFTSWERNPDYKPKLLMVEILSPQLGLLHKEILQRTKQFPIFTDVEGKNFNPHFTLGELREGFEERIPKQVSDFVRNAKIKSFKVYLRVAYIHVEKGGGFQKIPAVAEIKSKNATENNMENHKLFEVSQNAIIQNTMGEILILKKDGKWMLPGGRLKEGENWFEGLSREIREETGITNFSIEKILDVDNSGKIYFVTFLCKDIGNSGIKLSAEHQEYVWLNMKDINRYEFWHEKIKKRLESIPRDR